MLLVAVVAAMLQQLGSLAGLAVAEATVEPRGGQEFLDKATTVARAEVPRLTILVAVAAAPVPWVTAGLEPRRRVMAAPERHPALLAQASPTAVVVVVAPTPAAQVEPAGRVEAATQEPLARPEMAQAAPRILAEEAAVQLHQTQARRALVVAAMAAKASSSFGTRSKETLWPTLHR